ncbi:hypothetical protein FN846DRAFT_426729 [Sphaerosporella brunnea]|uniref:Uncharacterized protein n=1 Tax=Sphaerosporella brunnea TaxID=1250544 RepID=A0A5J5F555_9PEZI|nr:hypothetical protein FN846DRAFT_426729 [Sphaerosporella brunnea]
MTDRYSSRTNGVFFCFYVVYACLRFFFLFWGVCVFISYTGVWCFVLRSLPGSIAGIYQVTIDLLLQVLLPPTHLRKKKKKRAKCCNVNRFASEEFYAIEPHTTKVHQNLAQRLEKNPCEQGRVRARIRARVRARDSE